MWNSLKNPQPRRRETCSIVTAGAFRYCFLKVLYSLNVRVSQRFKNSEKNLFLISSQICWVGKIPLYQCIKSSRPTCACVRSWIVVAFASCSFEYHIRLCRSTTRQAKKKKQYRKARKPQTSLRIHLLCCAEAPPYTARRIGSYGHCSEWLCFRILFFFCVAGRKRAIPFPLDSTLLLWPWSRERQGYKPGSSSKHVRRTTEENEDREKETRMHTRNGTMTSRCRCCLLLLLLLLLCYVVAWRDECSRPPTNDLPALKPLLSITSSTSFTLEFVREFFSSSYP